MKSAVGVQSRMWNRATEAAGKGRTFIPKHPVVWMGIAMLAATLALPAALQAQNAPGGVQLTFGIDSRLVAQQNAGMIPGGTARSIQSNTRLSLGYLSETTASFLALDAAARLRMGNSSVGEPTGLVDPSIALSFRREAAGSWIEGGAFLRKADLTQAQEIDDFLPPIGTRGSTGGTLSYRWGEDQRVGFGLNASVTDTTYRNAPSQVDNRRFSLGGDVRLDVTEVAQLTFGVSRSKLKPEGDAARNTTALTAGLNVERPRGTINIATTLIQAPEGMRTSLSLGRNLDLPDGSISGRIGITRGVTGNLGAVAALSYTRDLTDGQFSVAFSREVTANAETDAESIITKANLGFTRELTPLTSLNLDFSVAESVSTATNQSTLNGNFGITLSHELGQDWLLDAGYQMRLRDQTGQPTARNSSIFVGLRRQFTTPY